MLNLIVLFSFVSMARSIKETVIEMKMSNFYVSNNKNNQIYVYNSMDKLK